jgi:hypothetical protein
MLSARYALSWRVLTIMVPSLGCVEAFSALALSIAMIVLDRRGKTAHQRLAVALGG